MSSQATLPTSRRDQLTHRLQGCSPDSPGRSAHGTDLVHEEGFPVFCSFLTLSQRSLPCCHEKC
jgi:hypothetical protein